MTAHNDDRLRDYRQNLIVEPNHPLLAFKALRDRYAYRGPTFPAHAGYPHLGCAWSEDALTWNVFRWLQGQGRYDVIGECLGAETPRTVLFWCVDCANPGGEQFALGDLIRSVDGKRRGQVTEPDLVLIGETSVHFVECKLGVAGSPRYEPWKGEGAKRFPDYLEWLRDKNSTLFKPHISQDDRERYYQLFRNVFYARALADRLGRPVARVTALLGKDPARLPGHHPSWVAQLETFRGLIDTELCEIREARWKGVRAVLERRLGPDCSALVKLNKTLQVASQAVEDPADQPEQDERCQ